MHKPRSRRKEKRGSRTARRVGEGSEVVAAGAPESRASLQFTRLNWILLGGAAVVLLAGFAALGSGSLVASTVVAPLLLVAGYGVLIPLGLIL